MFVLEQVMVICEILRQLHFYDGPVSPLFPDIVNIFRESVDNTGIVRCLAMTVAHSVEGYSSFIL